MKSDWFGPNNTEIDRNTWKYMYGVRRDSASAAERFGWVCIGSDEKPLDWAQ